MPKISIIIPIYNTPKQLLNSCFESIKKQTFTDFEIIVIDDGSTVECAHNIDTCITELPQVHLIRKKNEGVSIARNEGLKIAKGEYVCFVDSDNTLPCAALAYYNKYLSKKPDIIIGLSVLCSRIITDKKDCISVPNKTILENPDIEVTEYIANKSELVDHLLGKKKQKYQLQNGYFADGPCGKLYKTSIAKSISFPENLRWNEDTVWLLNYINVCDSILLMRHCVYFTIAYEYSATRRFRENCIQEYIDVTKEEEKIYEFFPECKEGFIYRYFSNVLLLARLYFFHEKNKVPLVKKYAEFVQWINLKETVNRMHFTLQYLRKSSKRACIYKTFAMLAVKKNYMICFILLKLYSMR